MLTSRLLIASIIASSLAIPSEPPSPSLATFAVDSSGVALHDYSAAPQEELQGDFFLACMAGDVPVARNMLAQGASLTLEDSHGRTPLSLAAINAKPALVAALLELGAQPDAVDKSGRTPMDAVQVLLGEAAEDWGGGASAAARRAERARDLEAVRKLLLRAGG